MKSMQRIAASFLITILTTLFISSATYAESPKRLVINELRKLKSTLLTQDPTRKEIALRLADRLADEALLSHAETQQGESDRLEAIAMYQEVITDRNSEKNSEDKNKIQFQLARLYAEKQDAQSIQSAKTLFTAVKDQTQMKELKRESILRLAEYAENSKAGKLATDYYREALTLCEGSDSCSYSHYRLGWIERNQDQWSAAIEEMKLALWDSKGNIREEALRDLISFMGLAQGRSVQDMEADMAMVDQLSKKISRPLLLQDLAYAYFASGNKKDAVKVLSITHARQPNLYSGVRLLEEFYGLKDWDQFRSILSQMKDLNTSDLSEKDQAEVEKIGRRLATQLDGERTTDANHYSDFKDFTLLYLGLFPRSSERVKIMEGLVVAEPSVTEKLSLLKQFTPADPIRFREMRAAIAQKEKLTDVVVEEMSALAALKTSKQREYEYALARAEYERKNFAIAAPMFEKLAVIVDSKIAPDTLAVQSQNLLLDIYNQQKNLPALIRQAKLWPQNPEMDQIIEQAEFEQATAMGQTEQSLEVFTSYCTRGKFTPKSCENARVIAIQLNAHPKLITILETQYKNDPSIGQSLLSEYENGGYFSKAAELSQNLNAKNMTFETHFKIALMHELSRNLTARNAVLKQMSDSVIQKKYKLTELEEKTCLAFLNDSQNLSPYLLKVLQKPESQSYLAEALEFLGQGNAQTRTILFSQKTYQGPAWAKIIVNQAQQLADTEAKIKFYGRNGQTLFKSRVNRLKQLNEFADQYLNGSDTQTRIQLLSVLKASHDRVSSEILNSPLPQGLTPEQLDQVTAGLTEMAKPFQEKVAALQKLLDHELSGESLKVSITQSSAVVSFDEKQYALSLAQLRKNPKDVAALNALKTIFNQAGLTRPAAYFEGRIQAL